MQIIQLRRPKDCPKCGARNIRRIYYGKLHPKIMKEVQLGSAIIGEGRFGVPASSDWECAACHHRWFDKDDPEKQRLEKLLQEAYQQK